MGPRNGRQPGNIQHNAFIAAAQRSDLEQRDIAK